MKIKFLPVFLFLIANCLSVPFLSAQTLTWAKAMIGSVTGSLDGGNSIITDASGNVYTTGQFTGTVDFDPGPGVFNLTSAGGNDIFISKLDASGNFVWAESIGGKGNDAGNSIAIDISGNIYTTGFFNDTVDFDPGTGVFKLNAAAGSNTIFISKLNASGNFVWAKELRGSCYNGGVSIAIDASGDVYTTGTFSGTINFDPGAGTYNITSTGQSIFISKLNALGNFVWAKAIGGNQVMAYSLALDHFGNVFTTGYFGGTNDFDPGSGVFNITSINSSDAFISKLDVSGNFVWAKDLGGTGSCQGTSISTDSTGNVYTTGRFNGTDDFDPGAGIFDLTSGTGGASFISKLDASGNFVWAKGLGGGTGSVYSNSITISSLGYVLTTGFFSGVADFDPGQQVFNLTATGNGDIFVSKLDSSGHFISAKALASSSSSRGSGNSIATDATSSNIYLTGYFVGTVNFDPNSGIFNLTSTGNQFDIFIAKYHDYCWTQPVPICLVTVDSLSFHNIIVWDKPVTSRIDSFIIYREYTSNNYVQIGAVPYGSLSEFIDTVYTRYFPITGDPNVSSYRYKLQVLDTCGNYSSLSEYHNTVHMINNNGNFSWNFYDIENEPNPVTFYVLKRDNLSNGNWITVAGVSGTQNSISDPQYSTYQNTANYRVETQWNISCSPTRSSQSTKKKLSGSKSNSYRIMVSAINEVLMESPLSVFPNPSRGEITIKNIKSIAKKIEVYNVYGQKVFSQVVSQDMTSITFNLPNGLYFAQIETERGIAVKKITISE